MIAPIVRCPYCVAEHEFKQMVAHLDGRLICGKCGHMAKPGDSEFRCQCSKCLQMTFPAGLGRSR